MTKSYQDQRQHRRKVAGTTRGLTEHNVRARRRKGEKPMGGKGELVSVVTAFRKGILDKQNSSRWCFAVCAPLESLLPIWGYSCELTHGHIGKWEHCWLTLPNGEIVDPTADQFKKPNGEDMPAVYFGEKPTWYNE